MTGYTRWRPGRPEFAAALVIMSPSRPRHRIPTAATAGPRDVVLLVAAAILVTALVGMAVGFFVEFNRLAELSMLAFGSGAAIVGIDALRQRARSVRHGRTRTPRSGTVVRA